MKGKLIVVPGFSNKVIRAASKIAPRRMLARIAGKMNRDR
jgi:short-subunit dehydrogenase